VLFTFGENVIGYYLGRTRVSWAFGVMSVAEARDAVQIFREDFNEVRPHSALDDQTPAEFARRYAATLNPQRLAS
jgi:transposase InsO family protein